MKALRYLGQRLFAAAATIFVIVSLAWLVTSVLPGDPARLIVGPQASEEVAARVRHEQGLDQSLPRRYVTSIRRLVHWGPRLGATPPREHRSCIELVPHVHLDLGFSALYQQPVAALVAKRAPRSIVLGGFAFLFQLVVGAIVGAWAAARGGTRSDEAATTAMTIFATVPSFVVGLGLQYLLAHRAGLLPLDGFGRTTREHAASLVLPTLTLGLYASALFARVTRTEVKEALDADFARTARAKGASPFRVTIVHALRAALLPIATLAALDLGALVGGAVVTEKLFRIQGMGETAVNAVLNRDAPLVAGTVLIASAAIVAATLLADVLGLLLDPRLRRRGES